MTAVAAPQKTQIFIVDDHPMMRAGLRHLIDREPDLAVCGEAATAAEALDAVSAQLPDLMLVDITLPGKSGIDLIKEVHARHAGLPALVISMHDELIHAERALRAGASGYVMKQEGGERLMEAVRAVLAGEVWISQGVAGKLRDLATGQGARAFGEVPLNPRELAVFLLLGYGGNPGLIVEHLRLEPEALTALFTSLKTKLGLASDADLSAIATEWIAAQRAAR